MEIKAVKLEKKNPTELSVGDYIIIAGLLLMIAGGVYPAVALLS